MLCKVLGPLLVAADDAVIPMVSVAQRRLMSILVLRTGTVSSTDFLAHHLQLSPGAVRTSVSRLRRHLGTGFLETGNQGYELRGVQCDATVFEERLQLARAAEDDAVALRGCLRSALELWRGEPYGEFALEEWASAESVRLGELQADAVERLVDLLLASGDHTVAIVQLERHIAQHPFRDRPRGQHMRALVQSGRRVDALRVFQRYRSFLIDEIGTGPTAELVALDRSIASDDDGPAAPDSGANLALRTRTTGIPPTGVVTFLVCDVADSGGGPDPDVAPGTDLARTTGTDRAATNHGAAKRAAIVDVMTRHDGFVFASGTTGVAAGFIDPVAAVNAAVAALLQVPSPGEGLVGNAIRLAVHTGMALARNGDYAGPALHVATELLSAAHPNQILLTSATRAIVREHIFEDNVAIRSRGTHQLGDVANPIELFELEIDDVASSDAPLLNSRRAREPETTHAALATGSHSALRSAIPEVRNPLVGRDDAVHEVRQLLKSHRVVMLTGPGGIGKTALALEIAAHEAAEVPESVFFVDLAPVGVGGDVSAPFFRALGLQPNGLDQPSSQLADALAARSALLLVDNCEQVLDGVADVLLALGRCHGLRVLATSREALAIPGECVWRVSGLPVRPTAVGLFEDRARAADSSFRVGPGDEPVIADICRRLDGIPLAIELAASRVRSLSLVDIRDGLDGRLRTLTAPRRGVAPRQRSLEAIIAWSYDMLTESEQWLLRQLAVFPDGFSSDDVGGITAWQPVAVLDMVDALVAKSLVEMVRPVAPVAMPSGGTTATRFRLLESIRAFASDRLVAASEYAAVQDRHLDHLLATEGATPDLRVEHVLPRVYIRDFPNLRAAANRALETGRVVDATRLTIGRSVALVEFGAAREGLDWLGGRGELTPSDQLWALNGCAYLAMAVGDRNAARGYMQESLTLSGGEPFDAMPNAFGFAAINDLYHDDENALLLINRAVDIVAFTPSGSRHLPFVHHVRALVHLHARQWDAAVNDALAVRRFAPVTSPYGGTGLATYLVAQTVRGDTESFAEAFGGVRRNTRVGAHEWSYRLFDLLSSDLGVPDAEAAARLAHDALAPNSGPIAQRCADLLAVLLWRAHRRGRPPADDGFTAASVSSSPFGALAVEAAGMSRGWSDSSWSARRSALGLLAQTSESSAMAIRSVWALTEPDVADAMLRTSGEPTDPPHTVLR